MLVSDQTVDGTPVANLTLGSEKRVMICCDCCGKVSTTIYSNYARSQLRRGYPGTTYYRGCAAKIGSKAKLGKPSWNKGRRLLPEQLGANHSSWRGGRYIDAHGYVMVHRPSPNARSKWEHYVKEHILFIEEQIGRKLERNEIVHHIDGDKQNNQLSNLYLTNATGHRNAHQSIQEIGYELVKSGSLTFDRKQGIYVAQHKLRELLEQPGEANQQPSQSGNALEGPETRCESS